MLLRPDYADLGFFHPLNASGGTHYYPDENVGCELGARALDPSLEV